MLVISKLEQSGNCHFLIFSLNVNANACDWALGNVLGQVSDFVFGISNDIGIVLLDVTCEKVQNVNAALKTLVRHVGGDLDFLFLEILLEAFELFFGQFVFSDETENTLGFEFSEGSCALIISVKFADTDFSGSFKDTSLVFFGESLNEILLHFTFAKLKVEVDVEGSEEDFLSEVVLIVEFFGFFSIMELDFDESVL